MEFINDICDPNCDPEELFKTFVKYHYKRNHSLCFHFNAIWNWSLTCIIGSSALDDSFGHSDFGTRLMSFIEKLIIIWEEVGFITTIGLYDYKFSYKTWENRILFE